MSYDSVHDAPETAERIMLAAPTPMATRRLLLHQGQLCPVYRKVEDGDEDTLNNSASDEWTESYYSDPEITGDESGGNTGPQWALVGKFPVYRFYHREDVGEEDGRGAYMPDRAIMLVMSKADIRAGDRVKYGDDIHQLQNDTEHDIITEWLTQPDYEDQG